MSKSQNMSIYLDDTIETFLYEKEALEIKLKHNISQLSAKNVYLSTVLKELCVKEQENIKEDCEVIRDIITNCNKMEDDLVNLDILEKKTTILKSQVEAIYKRFAKLNEAEQPTTTNPTTTG